MFLIKGQASNLKDFAFLVKNVENSQSFTTVFIAPRAGDTGVNLGTRVPEGLIFKTLKHEH